MPYLTNNKEYFERMQQNCEQRPDGPQLLAIAEIENPVTEYGQSPPSLVRLLDRTPQNDDMIDGATLPDPSRIRGVLDASTGEASHLAWIYDGDDGEMRLYIGAGTINPNGYAIPDEDDEDYEDWEEDGWRPPPEAHEENDYGHRFNDPENLERYSVSLSQLEDGINEQDFIRRGEEPPPWAQIGDVRWKDPESAPGNLLDPRMVKSALFFMRDSPDCLK